MQNLTAWGYRRSQDRDVQSQKLKWQLSRHETVHKCGRTTEAPATFKLETPKARMSCYVCFMLEGGC